MTLKHTACFSTSGGYMASIIPKGVRQFFAGRAEGILSMNAQTKFENAGQILWFGDNLMTIRTAASVENDQISIIECRMPAGGSSPLQVTLSGDELIHILEGMMRFQIGDTVFLAHVGQTVMAPKGIPHDFQILSADGATCLIVTQGGEFEQMVRQMSRPAPSVSRESFPDNRVNSSIEVVGAPLP
ncbi:Cupin domain protein [Aminobacter niigataensis]|nr:Cupin domain protein [Aminobacter niigataensis]